MTAASPLRSVFLPVLVAAALTLPACMFSSGELPPATSDNPLPPCPDSPNCERTSRSYDVPADTVYAAVQRALDDLGPTELRLRPDSLRAAAVYRVVLVFKDDVDVAVQPAGNGSLLHVRSASRVGQNDLGVNRRRVHRLFSAVREHLPTGP